MSIKEWPEDERPREKLLRQGPGGLSDAELLAIFLRTGVSGLSAVDLSRHLLQQFGSLRALLGAEQRAFARRTALTGQICPAAGGAGDGQAPSGRAVAKGRSAHLAPVDPGLSAGSAADRPREVFALLLLDNQHRVIQFVELLRHPRLGERLAQRNRADRTQT